MKKILLLVVLSPLLFLAYLIGAQTTNAQNSQDNSAYIISENSFEHSLDTDLYYETVNNPISYQALTNKLLGYVWTKTGDIVSVFDIDSANQKTKDNKTGNPATQTSGNSTAYLSAIGFLGASSMAKILGPGHAVFAAAGHPWLFLMTLSFGTLIFSLWFLRLSTGVSPPADIIRI